MSKNTVAQIEHRALGAMLRLTLADGASFDLTHQEARTLARAMKAVVDGKGRVDEIYMSPIASDRDFSAKVTAGGLLLEQHVPPRCLTWTEVASVAAALADLAGPG